MNIALGADHRGFEHKRYIMNAVQQLHDQRITWVDVGAFDDKPSDYPYFAEQVCALMQAQRVDKGILICGSGVGMAITANRFAGIYAAVVWSEDLARLSVEHDNVNCLVLPSDFVSCEQSVAMIKVWLSAHFLGDRHRRRLAAIDNLGGVVAKERTKL